MFYGLIVAFIFIAVVAGFNLSLLVHRRLEEKGQ